MTYKRQLTKQIQDMYCVVRQFEKNNEVVIERWTIKYEYTLDKIILELNEMIDLYNKKYGKRWGMIKNYSKTNQNIN
jgi:hypothetical protein